MEILAIIFLIGIAIYTYIDHQDPDKKAESLHPFDHNTVNANNERKSKQIETLENKVRKLNYADPSKEYYRQGAKILERTPPQIPKKPEISQQAHYEGTYQHDIQKRVEGKFTAGITEYPTLISLLNIDMSFTEDGQSVVLTVDASKQFNKYYIDLDNLKQVIKDSDEARFTSYSPDVVGMMVHWIDCIQIVGINEDQETATYDIVITIPDRVVLTDEYIAHEIGNIGRVFMGNHINSSRHLLPSQGKNRIERKNGRLMVYVDRRQTVPSFLDRKQRVMSEKQITRNIKNRLLNRVDVKCLSIDNNTYCGEILVT